MGSRALLASAAALMSAATLSGSNVGRDLDLQDRRQAVISLLAQQPEVRVISSKIRRALAIETSVGPAYVWVAPTKGGGQCHVIDVTTVPVEATGAACSPSPPRADYVIRQWQSETPVGDGSLRLLSGRVTSAVASVEVRYADGASDELRPAAGFVMRELRAEEEPLLVIARNAHGSELRRRPMPGPRTYRRDLAFPTGPYRRVIELGRISLAVAPGTNGAVCERTVYREAQRWSCGPGPALLEPNAISVDPGPWRMLEGSVGRAIARLEVWYEDGGAARIPIVERFVLFEVPKGLRPRLLVGLDSSGAIVARQRL